MSRDVALGLNKLGTGVGGGGGVSIRRTTMDAHIGSSVSCLGFVDSKPVDLSGLHYYFQSHRLRQKDKNNIHQGQKSANHCKSHEAVWRFLRWYISNNCTNQKGCVDSIQQCRKICEQIIKG